VRVGELVSGEFLLSGSDCTDLSGRSGRDADLTRGPSQVRTSTRQPKRRLWTSTSEGGARRSLWLPAGDIPCAAENPSSFTGQPPGRRNLNGAGDVAAPNICMHVSTST
jgi:hypothetical protein